MDGKLNTYQQIETSTKSQLDLILKVYDGAIKEFKDASESYKKEEYNKGYEHLEKSRKFLTHLYSTLDMDKGGEVAENLGKLYVFMINQVNVAEATKDLKLIDENINILNNIRSGWKGLKDEETQNKNNQLKNEHGMNPGQFSQSV
jgi:flagellar secretion chaperone FliS